jgi:hypothetical protein
MPAEALQSSNISCAHESCLVIQLKLFKTICQLNQFTQIQSELSREKIHSEFEEIHSKSDVFILIWQMVFIGFHFHWFSFSAKDF